MKIVDISHMAISRCKGADGERLRLRLVTNLPGRNIKSTLKLLKF